MGARGARARMLGAAVAVAVAVAAPAVAAAGGWHDGASLICSDCHTMHNSAGGAPMRYDGNTGPGPSLLRSASPLALCLACHDGSRVDAPDVMGERAAAYEAVDPAGGSFPDAVGVPSDSSHDLALAGPVLPPDGDTAVVLTCATCHEPHGGGRFRNLRESPSGTGRANGVEIVVLEQVAPNGGNPAQAYASANVSYRAGVTAWCLDCHNRYDEGSGHPSERTISGSVLADYDYWFNTPFEKRVRVQDPADPTPTVPSPDDQVFCLSCHKAHGSPILSGQTPNPDALIYADGVTLDSTCNQCHNM